MNNQQPSVCFHCNGYYGPSFGQPVCATCHMFLYPDDSPFHSSSVHQHDLKVDDGDSGNEEPKEPPECNPQNEQTEECLSLDQEDLPPLENQTHKIVHFLSSSQDQNLECCINPSESHVPISELNGKPPLPSEPIPERPLLNNPLFELPIDWKDITANEDVQVEPTDKPEGNQETDIQTIPPEVLLVIFRLLDEVSLWSVGHVCRSWSQLVSNFTLNEQWKVFTQRRWPLFNPIYNVTNWHKVFTNLIESAPCQLCFLRMPYNSINPAHENSWRRNRLSNELRTLRSDPPEGISASPLDQMSLHWQASIRGPAGSPYQGGTFFLYIQIPSSYPLSPPLVRFITRIFHPNVSRHGDIGIDSIQHNWSLALTISKVLISIQSLLTDPYTKVCMESRIGDMYDENRSQFDRIAKAWTWNYAMHDAIDPESMVPNYLHKLISTRYKNYEETLKNEKVGNTENIT